MKKKEKKSFTKSLLDELFLCDIQGNEGRVKQYAGLFSPFKTLHEGCT